MPPNVPEYIEPSPKARWILAILVGLFLVGYIAFQRLLIGDLAQIENPTESDVQALTVNLIVTTGLTALVSLFISIVGTMYFWRLGRRAIASSQFPPPGTLAVKRTKISTGRVAKIQAWFSMLLAVILWIPTIFFAYLFFLALEQP